MKNILKLVIHIAVASSFLAACEESISGQAPIESDSALSQGTEELSDTEIESMYRQLAPPRCGFSNAAHNKIVGGRPAARGAWPWLAALGPRMSRGGVFFKCGGALISSTHVLTAAHCMDEAKPYVVRLGEYNLESNNDGASPIDVPVSRRRNHPRYNARTFENDISILKLSRAVAFTRAIHPICLPVKSAIRNSNYVGKYPFVAGWGAIRFEGPGSDVLREVQVPVVTNDECKRAYSRSTSVIDSRVLCAGYKQGGRDSCQGDSGGPFMLANGNTWYVIGVVSNGFECARAGYPGIYTRTASFLPWIVSNMT